MGLLMRKNDELSLVKGLKNGDQASFEYLVREYGGYLMSVTRRYLKSEADVQDSVQDSFLQAYNAMKKFEGRSNVKSWLHRIAVNTALMRIRANGHRPEGLIEDSPSLFDESGNRLESGVELLPSVESEAINTQTRDCVRRYIQTLPDLSRNLLLLRDIEGYSTEETADLMSLSIASVKTGLHRARRALKQAIQEG